MKSSLLFCLLPVAAIGLFFAYSSPVTPEKPAPGPGVLHDSNAKTGAKKPDTPGDDYELRGFFGTGDTLEVSLRGTRTDKGGWYRVGESSGGVLVEKADSQAGTATLVVNGLRRTLRLAGEVMPETVREKMARRLKYAKALHAYFEQLGNERCHAIMENAFDHGIELQRLHPEYFDERASGSAAAKAAILAIAKETILSGSALPDAEGHTVSLPADANALINELYGDTSISIRHEHVDLSDSPLPNGATSIEQYGIISHNGASTQMMNLDQSLAVGECIDCLIHRMPDMIESDANDMEIEARRSAGS